MVTLRKNSEEKLPLFIKNKQQNINNIKYYQLPEKQQCYCLLLPFSPLTTTSTIRRSSLQYSSNLITEKEEQINKKEFMKLNLNNNNYLKTRGSQQLINKSLENEQIIKNYRNRFSSYGGGKEQQLLLINKYNNIRKHSLIKYSQKQSSKQIIRAESQEGGLEIFLKKQLHQKQQKYLKDKQKHYSSQPSLILNNNKQKYLLNNNKSSLIFKNNLNYSSSPSSNNNSPLASPKSFFQQKQLNNNNNNSRHSSPSNSSISESPLINNQQLLFNFYNNNNNQLKSSKNTSSEIIYSSQNLKINKNNCNVGTEFKYINLNNNKSPQLINKNPNIPLRRCPQSDLSLRFQKNNNNTHYCGSGHHFGNIGGTEINGSRGSSFSSSTESTPTRCLAIQLDGTEGEIIDPVYLALKQATCKYGNNNNSLIDNGGGSKTGSRRGSQLALTINNNNNSNNQLLFESCTPSPRNLSQISLQDSGYAGCGVGRGNGLLGDNNNTIGSSSPSLLVSGGSTPHLHGIGSSSICGGGLTTTTTTTNNINNKQLSPTITGVISKQYIQQQKQQTNNNNINNQNISGGRRPKLSEKMKSLSLDCADMPPPVQMSGGLGGRNQYFKGKQLRSARGYAASGESFENSFERSESPPTIRPIQPIQQQQQLPRRLPPAPSQSVNNTTIIQQQIKTNEKTSSSSSRLLIPPIGTHIVIHEYVNGECSLFLGDRLVVLDNGDPDWKHGFKVNDRLQQLFTFPSTCISAFKPNEQPMRLTQNCNLVEQKLRLYRDQVVFVQPNSLKEDGRVNIRNEHGTCAYCPLQFLMLI